MKIKDIVDIQSGYQFRGQVKPSTSKDAVSFIQIRDVDAEQGLNRDGIVKIDVDVKVDRYLVQEGDVIFLARGANLLAVAISEPLVNTIATGYFFILRLKTDAITPGYLAWFLNQPRYQARWQKFMQGSHMQLVSKSDIQHIEIELPPLATQRVIVELDALRREESRLLDLIQAKREQLIRTISTRAVTHGVRSGELK